MSPGEFASPLDHSSLFLYISQTLVASFLCLFSTHPASIYNSREIWARKTGPRSSVLHSTWMADARQRLSGGLRVKIHIKKIFNSPCMDEDANNGYDTLIFDLGDVLLTWSADSTTAIAPDTFHRMLDSPVWHEHEKGRLSEEETYAALASQFDVPSNNIRQAMRLARETLSTRPHMVNLIRALKPGRKVYAMSNIAAPSWEFVKSKGFDLELFDAVFTSAAAGERKPQFGFYRYVLQQTGADPARTIFVDDKRENLVSARSFGLTTVHYDKFENVERTLHNLCGDPIARASHFLSQNAKRHVCYTSTGQTIYENYCQLLILEATNDPSIVDYTKYAGAFNFFIKGRVDSEFTTPDFPDDLDTTSIAFTAVPDIVDYAIKMKVLDRMLDYCDSDGIPLTYFDRKRPRRDHAVVVNVLTLFYTCGRGHELDKALDWIHTILINRAYIDGTRYYLQPEVFLYFMTRLLASSVAVNEKLGAILKECVQERIGSPGDALTLAMRVHCCNETGLDAKIDLDRLLAIQQLDGGWDGGWFYKYAMKDFTVGNRGLSTAIAQKAIRESRAKAKLTARGEPNL